MTAQSVGAAELAVQVTQASLCPCSIVFNSLQLQLQAGLAHSTRSVAGMEPPFRIAPSSAHSFLFFVDHSAASGAARAVLQSCRLTSSYVILRDDLENLELVVLDATGRVVPPHKQSGSFNTNTAVSSSAVQTPQKQKKGGGGADEAGGDNKLPQALANTVLYVPDPTEPVNGSMKSARSGEGHVVAVPGDDVGVVAASCVHSHIFRLELPSFSFTAHQSGMAAWFCLLGSWLRWSVVCVAACLSGFTCKCSDMFLLPGCMSMKDGGAVLSAPFFTLCLSITLCVRWLSDSCVCLLVHATVSQCWPSMLNFSTVLPERYCECFYLLVHNGWQLDAQLCVRCSCSCLPIT